MMKKMRRVLSFLLALIMVAQYVPAGVFAVEEDNLCPHHTEHNAECHYEEGLHKCLFECTQCTPEEPDQDPTEPSENLAKLSDEPTEPSEDSEEPTEPSEEPTKPSEEPTEPSEEPTKPSEEPTEPSGEPTEPDAVCSCESDDADWHAPFCPLYAAPEEPECYCVEKCADGAVNEWCDVCYFDAAACAASGEEEGVQLDGTPVYIQSIAVAKDGSSGQTGINDCKNALKNAGYTVLDVDLNDGAGGDYIYMGYKTTTDPAEAIRGIIIRNGEYAPDTITHGNNGTFHKLGTYSEPNATGHGVVDLNSGCGSRSDYLYFYVTRSESYGGPVTELAFRTGKGNTGLDGFSVVTDTVYEAADANEGASGSYIYLFEKRFSVDIVIQTYYFHTAYEGPSVTFYDDKYHFSDHTRTYNVYFNGLRQFNYNGVTWTIAGFRDDDTIAAPNIKHGFLLTYQSAPYMVLRHVYSTTSTLSFDANGGTGAPASLSGIRYLIARKGSEPGETTLSLTIPATVPVWADKCAFLGWAASADATTAAYQPGDTYTLTSGNPTLYAVWQEHTGDTVCGNCGKSFAAPDQSNGVYQLSNKEELIWFMQYVNQGNMNASAVVTANIDMGGYVWTPIASTDSYHVSAVTDKGYTGTFDGAGHVISNFKINGGSDGIKSYGLFGTVSGTVKNLGIRNVTFTVGSADCRAGGIAGQLLTGGRIENCCVTNSSITTGTRIAGGIAGCNYGGTIDRCYAYNNTVTGHSRCAAVVGDTVTDSSAPAKLTGTVTNCYADKKPVGSQNGGSSYVRNCGQLTADQFASGEATWLLNGSSASGAWKQTCGTGLPTFSGKTVYQVKRCDGVTVYSNESQNPQDHRYVNNVCTICGDVSSDAVAKVSFIGNNGTYFATLEDALAAVEDLDASGEGVVQLLRDVPMGNGYLSIGSGVFTLDLNDKILSNVAYGTGAVNVSGSNTDVTIRNGTISGVNSAINTYDSGKVTLENVTMTAGIGINTSENSEVILRGSEVNGSTGLLLHSGTVHVYDSAITGEAVDIYVQDGGAAFLHEGVFFPGGITVDTTTLNDVLAEGQAYWAGETMLYAAADATEITDKGDVTVKAACSHENGEKSYVNNGDNHIFTYSCCGLEDPEDHDYTATGICACGKSDPNAEATLSKDGKLVLAGTLETVMTEARKCAAADKAVVQLMQDVSMGEEYLHIWAGVFTLDLNGKTLSSTAESIGAVNVSGSNTDVTFRNGTISGGNNAVTPYNSSKVTLENVTLTGADGVSTSGNCEVILRSSVVNASSYGLALYGGTVHVYDSVITGEAVDISVRDGGATFLHEDVSFPGGITVDTTTLNDVLAEGMAYWAGETMLYAAADATKITDKGDVTVKAACTHENGEKSYVNNGDNHIVTYSCCGLEAPEDHDYTATGICACGKIDPDAQATLSKDGKIVMAGTLDAVIIKAWACTAADKAVVQLLRDVPMGNGYLSIDSGVFTLDLNDKILSSVDIGLSAVSVHGSNTDVIIRNGTISGGNNAVSPRDGGKVTLENVTLTGAFGISSYENSEVILRSSVVNGSTYGLLLHGGTVHVYDSTITGDSTDIAVWGGSAVLHEGVSFPGGITVNTTTLNDVLAEDLAYWAGETMLYAAADATEITDKGDVTVKAACVHKNGEKSYVNNGDNHIYTYSCCGLEVPENHNYTATGICICGKIDPDAQATLSKDGKIVMAGTLDAVITKAQKCTAADKALVQLLQDVPMGNGCLSIDSGVFTLDLNGKDISSDSHAIGVGSNAELVITDSSADPGTIRAGENAFTIWQSSGKVTIEKGNFFGQLYVSGGILTMVDGYVEAAFEEPLYNNGGDVRLQGGTLNADSNLGWIRSDAGKVTVSGSPVFAGTASGETFRLLGGIMDLSGMADPSGLTLRNNSGTAVSVSDVLLPEGYFFWLNRTAAEDTLLDNNAYTISQTTPDDSDADQKQINLYLKPVDEAGNEIQDYLDVCLNNGGRIGTESLDYGYATVNIGENILSGWGYYPNGYICPTADITFTYDLENGITITSGNAAAEQVGDTWYVVVTLTAPMAYPQVPENGWPIWVAGTVVTEDNCEDILGDGTVSYDPETETLTFQDAFIEVTGVAVFMSELPLTVNILGENEFYSEDMDEYDYGFWFAYEEGTTEITGNGSVEIWSDDECIQMDGEDVELILSGSVEIMADPADSSAVAIDIESVVASMTIQDAVHLTIGSESKKHKEEGIYIGFGGTTYGSMTIQDDAVVTIYTSDEEGIYVGGYQEQMLTITGGTVYIEADEEALQANTITISGGNITAIGGVGYEGIYASDLTITGGAVLVGCGDNGHAIEAQNITITGGTVRAINGGMIAVTVGGETGGGIPGTITLGEGMIIAEPEGAEIGELAVESVDDITGEPVTDEIRTVVDADGKYADAFVITDGETERPKLAELWLAGVAMEGGDYLAVNARATSDTKPAEGGYAYYEDGILTLHDYTFEGEGYFHDGDSYAALYSKDDLELVLEGKNILNCVTDEDMDAKGARISGSLVVSGTGSLELSGERYGLYIDGGFTMNGGKMTVTGDRSYGIRIALDIVINGGHLIAGSENAFGLDSYEGNLTITGGTLEITKGGMDLPQYFDEMGEPATGIVTLGEGVSVTVPEGGQISTLFDEENYMYNTTVVDADGVPADAFVITDGKQPEPVYSGWTEIDGVWYYYDPETHEKFLDIAELTKGEGEEAVTGYYAFDQDTGAWMEDHTGVYEAVNGDLYYIEGGIAVKNYGLHKEVDANGHIHYYIFGCGLDDCKEGSILPGEEGQPSCQGEYKAQKNNFHMVSKLNGYELLAGAYDAGDDGVLLHYEDTSLNGICAVEGGLRYLINGVPVPVGLFEENGSLYYARTRGWLVVGTRYWISENKLNGVERNGVPVEAGVYEFDAEGRMIIAEDKNGFYLDNGAWYYYVDNKPSYEGLKYFDGTDGENGTNGGQMGPTEGRPGWYYINTYGMVIAGRDYWVTKNNGLMNSKTYCFDEYGTMTNPMDMNKAGIFAEDGSLYYYVAGERNYAGLIQYTGDLHHADGSVTAGIYNDDYLYVNTYGEVKNGCDYWITKNNGLMIAMTYNFDEYGRMTNPTISEPDEKVKNGIVREDDKLYYYVDGIRTYAGVIEIDGKYYYVRTHGELAANCSYWPTKHNGLVKVKSYVFDADGVMQDPVILK